MIDILFCNDNDLNKSPIWLMSQVQLYSPLILDINFQAWKVQNMKAKKKKKNKHGKSLVCYLKLEVCSIILALEVGPREDSWRVW